MIEKTMFKICTHKTEFFVTLDFSHYFKLCYFRLFMFSRENIIVSTYSKFFKTYLSVTDNFRFIKSNRWFLNVKCSFCFNAYLLYLHTSFFEYSKIISWRDCTNKLYKKCISMVLITN